MHEFGFGISYFCTRYGASAGFTWPPIIIMALCEGDWGVGVSHCLKEALESSTCSWFGMSSVRAPSVKGPESVPQTAQLARNTRK
jgi:hypothetical protein